jgi:hypothetical protein
MSPVWQGPAGCLRTPSGRFYGMGQGSPRLRLERTDSGVDPGEGLGIGACPGGLQGLSAVIHPRASPSGQAPGWTEPAPGWRAATTTRPGAGLSTLGLRNRLPGQRRAPLPGPGASQGHSAGALSPRSQSVRQAGVLGGGVRGQEGGPNPVFLLIRAALPGLVHQVEEE